MSPVEESLCWRGSETEEHSLFFRLLTTETTGFPFCRLLRLAGITVEVFLPACDFSLSYVLLQIETCSSPTSCTVTCYVDSIWTTRFVVYFSLEHINFSSKKAFSPSRERTCTPQRKLEPKHRSGFNRLFARSGLISEVVNPEVWAVASC
jgi:hypothetical protein